ncbi:MAG: aminoacyl-tRNA hydrolase, partial [Actinomycetota bacterium]|nr:aminoacyl-tRNA hydrolase [Actinomycetota bacterium]
GGAPPPWLVVGLGNPGPEYADTRHNVGQLLLNVLARRASSSFRSLKGRADVTEGRFAPGGARVVLARPRSYMNESGGPVAAVSSYFKVPPERVVVLHDELDLPFGALRLKLGGGDNGHNGLRSIRRSLGTGDFHRVRLGIGRPPGRMDPAAFVLRGFSNSERKELDVHLERAADAVECLVTQGLERAQNDFNG